jgi:hypothetical protein
METAIEANDKEIFEKVQSLMPAKDLQYVYGRALQRATAKKSLSILGYHVGCGVSVKRFRPAHEQLPATVLLNTRWYRSPSIHSDFILDALRWIQSFQISQLSLLNRPKRCLWSPSYY